MGLISHPKLGSKLLKLGFSVLTECVTLLIRYFTPLFWYITASLKQSQLADL